MFCYNVLETNYYKVGGIVESSIEGILRGGKFKKLVEHRLAGIKDRTGLKRIDIEVIYFLYRESGHNTMTDICQHLQMNKGHISTVMDGLDKKGYLIQQHDPKDRRYVHYKLTELSDGIVKQMDASWEALSQKLMVGISDEDLEVFERVSKQIGQNIEHMLEE